MAELGDPQNRTIDVSRIGAFSGSAKDLPNSLPLGAEQWLDLLNRFATSGTAEAIYEVLLDQVGRVFAPATSALWICDAHVLRLVRHAGYTSRAELAATELAIDGAHGAPVLTAFQSAEPVWIPPQVCVPVAGDAVAGVLNITLPDHEELTAAEREFLALIARFTARALERVRTTEQIREANEARRRAERLYCFANAAVSSQTLDDVFDAALTAILDALDVSRAAILLFDDDGVMRFCAWRGLSDRYRAAVESHSPWKRDAAAPEPVLVPDCLDDEAWATHRPLFEAEGIGALGFIPLVSRGQLLGKFMVYYGEAHRFTSGDVDIARAIANYLGSTIARFRAVADLECAVRENELFAGVLAHDLRNPLAAIVTATQIALMHSGGTNDRIHKPLTRIMSSSDRMSNMIAQLLDFTRARVGGGR